MKMGYHSRIQRRSMGMKRKIWAVLLLLVLSVSCVACDMGEAVASSNSNAVVSEERVAEEKVEEQVEVTSTPSLIPSETESPTEILTSTPTPTIAPTPTPKPVVDVMVWLPATGEKYHNKNNCGRMNPDKARQVTKNEAERMGYEPCGKCY